jgi:hypothetical protein
MPSLDVIVPCYRYAHFLRECVTSVLAETAFPVRVIIIDDASPDETPAVAAQLAREDSRVSYVRHTTNLRHIATYNEGIAWAQAEYVLLLSADDYMLPGALRRAVEFMEAHPHATFAYGQAILTPDSGVTAPPLPEPMATWREQDGQDFIREAVARGTINVVPTPTAVVRTAWQKKLGGYRPELPHSGDLEMWLRLAAHGSVGVYSGHLAVWRRHATNMQYEYYRADYRLPDLQQRKAAVDCFLETCGAVLPDQAALRRALLAPLALAALQEASGAFNDGREDMVQQLADFALSTGSEITRTPRWKLLALKRRIGMRLWRSVYPAFAWATRRA